MRKTLLVLSALMAAGAAHAQANDTLKKLKDTGIAVMGVRESSGALSYTLGGGQYVGFHVELCQRVLRDIFDICRDTGLGANAYTVIEQGMVDRILSDRPDDRRHMFEEAAGIGRYKDRRKSAQPRASTRQGETV